MMPDSKPLKRLYFFLLILAAWYPFHVSYSAKENIVLKNKETELHQINHRIQSLKFRLSKTNNKRTLMDKELAYTEKKIGLSINKIKELKQELLEYETKIAALEKQSELLQQDLKKNQDLIAAHTQARYVMGDYQPLKWLFAPNKLEQFTRLNTYYLYVVQSRKKTIGQLKTVHNTIKINKQTLSETLTEKQKAEASLETKQSLLFKDKAYRQQLIDSLDKEIAENKTSLQTYETDKKHLEALIHQLSDKSIQNRLKPFSQMRRKLPLPVNVSKNNMKPIQQGLVFFTNEGTEVKAIYPGTVLFSDWLKGYGLLLIVDHGQGYMSLYAHNEALYKAKGSTIAQGEIIASVGHSGGLKDNGLYFEIRKNGKTISPLLWLS